MADFKSCLSPKIVMFDKRRLSNLRKAFLTSSCHSSKSSIHLNSEKKIIMIQYLSVLDKVVRCGPRVILASGKVEKDKVEKRACGMVFWSG
jgi:hypothetical protein